MKLIELTFLIETVFSSDFVLRCENNYFLIGISVAVCVCLSFITLESFINKFFQELCKFASNLDSDIGLATRYRSWRLIILVGEVWDWVKKVNWVGGWERCIWVICELNGLGGKLIRWLTLLKNWTLFWEFSAAVFNSLAIRFLIEWLSSEDKEISADNYNIRVYCKNWRLNSAQVTSVT